MAETGIYGWSPQSGGVHFHRINEPLRLAPQYGTDTATGTVLDDELAEQFDTILVHMIHGVRDSEAWEKLAANGRHRLVYDIDDVMWDPAYAPFASHYTPEVLERLERNIRRAHIVTTPSPVIAQYVAERWNRNVWYVPNTVPAYTLAIRREHPGHWTRASRKGPSWRRMIIGYQGSHSHQPDLTYGQFAPDLYRFLVDHPRWDFHVWGQHETQFLPGRTIGHRWQSRMDRYYRSISAMDIGLGPLRPNEFNRGKSALRVIEYAALGIVPVVTELAPYDGWIDYGRTGFTIPATPEAEWRHILHTLATEPEMLDGMSRRAREAARAWTTEENIGRWTEAWNSV